MGQSTEQLTGRQNRIQCTIQKSLQAAFFCAAILCSFGQANPTLAGSQTKSIKASKNAVATINIRGLSASDVDSLKNNKTFKWWGEFGDTLVVGADQSVIETSTTTFEHVWKSLSENNLRVIVAGHKNELPAPTTVIAHSGRATLVINNSALEAMASEPKGDLAQEHLSIRKFLANTTYVQSSDHKKNPLAWSVQQSTWAQAAMQSIDSARWYSDVQKLSGWNRHISASGVVSARDWLKGQFEALHPTTTVLQKFTARGRDAWNVIATFDAGPNADIYIVGGHYDSISEQVSTSAPGAEDNASGAAGVLELARVFAGQKNRATLIFIGFSGEEEGLLGSYAYVANATEEFKARIKSVMTMDMIGYSKDATTDVLLETASEFSALTAQYAAAASQVEGLTSFTSFNPWGSDHMPFIEKHIPAMLTIDNDWGVYPPYHKTGDTIDQISREMGTAILKMNAAVLAVMAGS